MSRLSRNHLFLAGQLVIALALCGACASFGSFRVEQVLPAATGDLTTAKTVALVDAAGDTLMQGTFEEASATEGKVSRLAKLTSPKGTTPSGTAEIVIERDNGLSDEEVQLKLKDLPYPATFRVMVDGRELATFSSREESTIEVRLNRRVTTSGGY